MKYYNLLILFMIALKCGADEKPTTVNDSAVENVTKSEIFRVSTTEGKLSNISSSIEPNGSENTLINASGDNAVDPFSKKEFGTLPLSKKLPRHRTRLVTNMLGSLMKGLAQLNEPNSEEDAEDDDEQPTTGNDSTVANVTNSEVFNTSTTEASQNLFDKWTQLPNINKSTLINATDDNAVSPFKKKEFSKLPKPRRHQQRWLMMNITGSLMKGLAQLNKPDAELDTEDNDEEPTIGNNSTVENITNSEISNASTTEAPEKSSSELPGAESTLINATDANAVNPFKKKEFNRLPIPKKLPRHRTRLVTNIIESLMKGLAQLKEPDSEEDDDEPTSVNYSTVENVTNSEVSNTTTTEAPDNRVDTTQGKWTQLPNISSSSESPGAENELINVTDANAVGLLKKKEFGKLHIPGKLPQQGTRIVKNIIGSLLKGLAQEKDSNEHAD